VALRRDAARLAEQGWTRWEAPGLAGLRILRDTLRDRGDITADWSLYGLNRLAREAIAGQGVSRAVLSPEDGAANIAALAGAGGPEAEAIVFQHTPLFISETAPCADWAKNAGTIRVCGSRGRGFIVHRVDGRWITASRSPFCLARHTEALARRGVPRLRVDLSWSPPECVSFPECWQDVRSGRAPAESREANFESGLE
jgi:hypothetical protein